MVAAAADHWFSSPVRAAICQAGAAAFPVRRTGGGYGDLAAAGPLLRAGRAVVVFPAGSRDGAGGGAFRSGAFRLAAEYGVPVVPAGITGTDRMLPKHGRFHRASLDVRFGTPMVDPAPADVQREVARLATMASARPDSVIRQRVARYATGRRALVMAFAAAFAEGLSWPLLPEAMLALLLLAAPARQVRTAARLCAVALAGSLLGGLTTLLLAAHGRYLPQPLTTGHMNDVVHAQYVAEGPAAIWHQPLSGAPLKVYARQAGQTGVPWAPWLGHAALARGARLATVAAISCATAAATRRWRHWYPGAMIAGAASFLVLLVAIVQAWRS